MSSSIVSGFSCCFRDWRHHVFKDESFFDTKEEINCVDVFDGIDGSSAKRQFLSNWSGTSWCHGSTGGNTLCKSLVSILGWLLLLQIPMLNFVLLQMGYANLKQSGRGIHTRQFARAFVVEDEHNSRVAFVSVDAGMIGYGIKREVSLTAEWEIH